MKLQLRTALIPVISVSILTLGLYFFITQVTLQNFNVLEQAALNRSMQRVQNAFDNAIQEHSVKLVDWARWDNTYKFLENKDETYVSENLNSLTLTALGYRTVLFLNSDLTLYHGVAIRDEESIGEPEAELVEKVRSILKDSPGSLSSLLTVNHDVFMFAAHEILPTSGEGESRGRIVAVAPVDESMFALMRHNTNLDVTFLTVDKITSPEVSKNFPFKDGDVHIRAISSEQISAFSSIKDVQGNPVVYFRIDDPRRIVQAGEDVRQFTLIGLAVTGLVAALLLVAIIRFGAIRRLEALIDQISQIASGRGGARLTDTHSQSRSLRFRTAASVLAIFAIMSILGGLVFSGYFLSGFEQVEEQVMRDNLTRSSRALEARLDKIKSKTIDWAQWDDTYNYIDDLNSSYEEANLGIDTLGSMEMEFVVYLDTTGKIRRGVEVSPGRDAVQDLPASIAAEFELFASLKKFEAPIAGFIKLSKGVYLFGASPILDTARAASARGLMIFAAPVNQMLAKALSKQVQLSLEFLPDTDGEGIQRISNDQIIGQSVVRDLSQSSVLSVRVTSPRSIYEQGLSASRAIPFYFALGGILCALVTVISVDLLLVARFRRIAMGVADIQETRDLSRRIEKSGFDEIGTLADQINSMLSALEDAKREVEAARDEAERANAAKSSFIAKVSHELRTPIHAVVGMLRILLKEETSKSKRAYIKMAKDAAYGLLGTINDILDFSKVESGNLTLETIEFSLRDAVRETMRTVGPRAEEKTTLELVCDLHSDVPDRLLGDPLRLKQILINLIGNAIKFTREGHVSLDIQVGTIAGPTCTLLMTVRDSGIGIPAERLPNIFEPFTQADDSISRVYTGTGLGLTIVKQLTEQMGGTVEVTSEVGKGTTFALAIPFGCVASTAVEVQVDRIEPKRVALIDGVSAGIRVLDAALARYGLESAIIQSGDPESLDAFMANFNNFGLMVVTSEAIKRSRVFNIVVELATRRAIPIVAILSPFEISVRERLTALDIPFVVTRPITPEDILLVATKQLELDGEAWDLEDMGMRAASKSLNILIADDAHTNRIILKNMLEDAGHVVTCVDNGQDLVRAIDESRKNGEQGNFDIVLTDVQMPIMDGLTATKHVREAENSAGNDLHIPIVAVTAHAMMEEKERMRACGVDDVVTKPIQPSELARVLQKLTGVQADNSRSVPIVSMGNSQDIESLIKHAELIWLEMQRDAHDRHQQSGGVSDNSMNLGDAPLSKVLNVPNVYERSGDSIRRTKLIWKAFLGSYKDQLVALAKGKNTGNEGMLQSAAHALKGLLLDVGAQTTGELASSIESACKRGEPQTGSTLVGELTGQTLLIARLLTRILEQTGTEASALTGGSQSTKQDLMDTLVSRSSVPRQV